MLRILPTELTRVLKFASVVEICTGVGFAFEPALLLSLLLGMETSNVSALMGRLFGVALISLGIACWPGRGNNVLWSPIVAMSLYNAIVAIYLTVLGSFMHTGGILLWPGVILHAVVAFLLSMHSFRHMMHARLQEHDKSP